MRVTVEGEKKKIEELTEEDIDLTEMETFDMLLETTKNRVLSDT